MQKQVGKKEQQKYLNQMPYGISMATTGSYYGELIFMEGLELDPEYLFLQNFYIQIDHRTAC